MKRAIIFLLALMICPVAAQAQITRDQAISEFVQGNLSYKEGDFDRAIEKYEGILTGGKASGSLYYNLANTYYRKGKLGKAIVNYERAKRMLPRDGDVNFNIDYARSKANLFGGEIGKGVLSRMIDEHISFYSEREMMQIIVMLAAALATLHLLSLYLRLTKVTVKPLIALLSLLVLIFVAGLAFKLKNEDAQAIALIKGEAKFEPRQEATTHFKVLEGDKLKVIKEEEEWVKIQRADGKLGWMPRQEIEKI